MRLPHIVPPQPQFPTKARSSRRRLVQRWADPKDRAKEESVSISQDGEYGMESTAGAKIAFEDAINISQQGMEKVAEASATAAVAARSEKMETSQEQEQVEADGAQLKNSISQHLDGDLVEGNNDVIREEDKFEFLGSGKSGVVYGIDSTRVLKVYHDEEAGEIGRRVYQRVGSHPNVANLLETLTDGSILLERGVSLRTICQASSFNSTPIQTKVRWLQHAAKGYQHLHDSGIIHADVGCNNLILAQDDYVKLIDFEGCSMDGGTAGSCYEWFSYCPSIPRVTRGTDIFAFGCAVYEVSTGRPPYYQLKASDTEVEALYAKKTFPSVAELPLGQLVHKCWNGHLSTMKHVIQELDVYQAGLIH
ncbi:hypothetical protein MMC18_009640 [Xylographa bjoerkii]|nr:hypothetical protein [Xylographa bjoerkii]